MRLFTKREKKVQSQRPGYLSSLRRELSDYYYEYGNRIDRFNLLLILCPGSFFGILASLGIEDGGELLVTTKPLLWVAAALVSALVGSSVFVALSTLSIAVVIGSEILRENSHPRKNRRRSIRENTRQLKEAVVNDRIPLANLERVRTSLRVRDDYAGRSGTGWYEQILVNRWRRQRKLVEGLLEISWQEALPEAIAYLTAETMTMHSGKPTNADLKDTTEVAWHLARNPADAAVQRLLSEYLPVKRKNGNGYLVFRTGVVYTPRWVYDLVRLVENAASASERAAGPWSFGMNRRMGHQDTIGNECAPIGDVDRETVEKLYEPQGDGPLGSLREAVETARRV